MLPTYIIKYPKSDISGKLSGHDFVYAACSKRVMAVDRRRFEKERKKINEIHHLWGK
jgi:hypothetical protein